MPLTSSLRRSRNRPSLPQALLQSNDRQTTPTACHEREGRARGLEVELLGPAPLDPRRLAWDQSPAPSNIAAARSLPDRGEASLVDSDGSANAPQEVVGAPAGPCTMVIFGAGGDLTKRLLIPAIFNLANSKLLAEHFALV